MMSTYRYKNSNVFHFFRFAEIKNEKKIKIRI